MMVVYEWAITWVDSPDEVHFAVIHRESRGRRVFVYDKGSGRMFESLDDEIFRLVFTDPTLANVEVAPEELVHMLVEELIFERFNPPRQLNPGAP